VQHLDNWPRSETKGPLRCPHRLLVPGDRPPLVLSAGPQELGVEVGQVGSLGHRHPVVAAEGPYLALHAALLVGLGRVAELRLEAPVGTEGDEARRLLSPRAA
jgi:hypothetical protein